MQRSQQAQSAILHPCVASIQPAALRTRLITLRTNSTIHLTSPERHNSRNRLPLRKRSHRKPAKRKVATTRKSRPIISYFKLPWALKRSHPSLTTPNLSLPTQLRSRPHSPTPLKWEQAPCKFTNSFRSQKEATSKNALNPGNSPTWATERAFTSSRKRSTSKCATVTLKHQPGKTWLSRR